MGTKVFTYGVLDTMVHRLSGFTKFFCFIALSFTVMLSFDIRVIAFVLVFSFIMLKISRIKLSQIRGMLIYVGVFLLVNVILGYLFSPEEGVAIYGTRSEIMHFFGRYSLTWEQLLYQLTKTAKYFAIIPVGIVFFFTTDPSELASSLNKVGLNYKACYAVALTLRYIPDVQRDYQDISLAQQARGLDMSSKASFFSRFKNALMIIVPLIFSTLDRIEAISNAMDLRRFGENKKRTWYSAKALERLDFTAMAVCVLIFIISILISIFINHSRFYNPFS